MRNSINFLIIIIMTWCGALGGLFFKKSSNKTKKINIFLLLGLCFYGTGALLNIFLLKYLPLTIVFPCNALAYIWTTLIGRYVFKETITKYNIFALMLISLGLYFLVL